MSNLPPPPRNHKDLSAAVGHGAGAPEAGDGPAGGARAPAVEASAGAQAGDGEGTGPHDNTWPARLKRLLLGKPKSFADRRVFEQMALVPFLAWVGLGADGLSSSSYGPEEAYNTLKGHTYLAVGLAVLTAVTVLLISTAYSRIIEAFPHGGGGYVVATKLLGERMGVVSGCALLVDYMLTITVSIAAAGDALFSFMPPSWVAHKLGVQLFLVVGLTIINVRGIRESVLSMMPVFVLFLVTHLLMIGGGIIMHLGELPRTAQTVVHDFHQGMDTLGPWAMLLLFVHAYSLGGGTYTGIEAVSNGLPIMREPRAHTARVTMIYMAVSLALTAAGLLVCYLLWQVQAQPGKTLNAVLVERLVEGMPGGRIAVVLTLLSEGALLVVAAQAGFIDGPRVLANMAVDSWAPRRFAALSERLTTQNGIVLMGAASLVALIYTQGDVRTLVVMYSINVFVTFSLSMFGMLREAFRRRREGQPYMRDALLFGVSFVFCATILIITCLEKFSEGGWVTLAVTLGVICLAHAIRRHYRWVGGRLHGLYTDLQHVGLPGGAQAPAVVPAPDPALPTAVLLVGGFGGLGIYTFLNIFKTFPEHFKSVIFVSVGVIDSGEFKGHEAIDELKARTQEALEHYVAMAGRLGLPATMRMGMGTDAILESDKICRQIAREFSFATFFAGRVVFDHERWYHALLHNETAAAVQKRLHWGGLTMVVLPARVH